MMLMLESVDPVYINIYTGVLLINTCKFHIE